MVAVVWPALTGPACQLQNPSKPAGPRSVAAAGWLCCGRTVVCAPATGARQAAARAVMAVMRVIRLRISVFLSEREVTPTMLPPQRGPDFTARCRLAYRPAGIHGRA